MSEVARSVMRAGRFLLVAAFAAAFAVSMHGRADVYSWVDHAGRLHVSNLPPPDDVAHKVTTTVSRTQPRPDDELQREVDALAERVRRLESDQRAASNAGPPPAPQVAVVTIPQYVPVPVPVAAPMPSVVPVEQDVVPSCNPTWAGCYGAWGIAPLPTIVVLQNVPRRHPPRAPRVPRPPFAWPHAVTAQPVRALVR